MKYPASFTLEATLVLGIVFMTFAMLLRQAYIKHDIVTGAMILEEAVEKSRSLEEKDSDIALCEQEAELRGNPRLWMGAYEVELEQGLSKVTGTASAGDWSLEIKSSIFSPGEFLRWNECIGEKIEDRKESGNGRNSVQKGDESELYGSSSGNGEE